MTPIRIQRKRLKGWRLPPNTVCVTRPGVFGNPYSISFVMHYWAFRWGVTLDKEDAAHVAVQEFRAFLKGDIDWRHAPVAPALRDEFLARLPALRGKNLACWCKPGAPCHADVLLEIANGPE